MTGLLVAELLGLVWLLLALVFALGGLVGGAKRG
jgi:hypothetical protein